MELQKKVGLAPLVHAHDVILILGSIPGDRSIALQEYYGHARNRFWPMLARLMNEDALENYEAKRCFLKRHGIALWDVAHAAIRPGSLDSAIRGEEANDIALFLREHRSIKCVAFNGGKARQLYDRYFPRYEDITYFEMRSTSPANAAFSMEQLMEEWGALFKKSEKCD